MLRVYPERADYTTDQLNGLPLIVTSHRGSSAFNLSPYQGENLRPVVAYSYDDEKLKPYYYEVILAYKRNTIAQIYRFRSVGKVQNSTGIATFSFLRACIYFTISQDTRFYRSNIRFYIQVHTRIILQLLATAHKSVTCFDDLQRELPDYNLQALAEKGRQIWDKALSDIQVEGGSDTDKQILYTSLYRIFERPVCISEGGRYFSAFDGKVHEDNGEPFYTDDWIWDTYRAAHPLRLLIDEGTEKNVIDSYLRMAEQMGNMWMPTFPEITGDSRRMNSNHAVATVADAAAKGLQFDLAKAYEACRKGIEKNTGSVSGAAAGWIE